jgi:rRNA maturation endonuclease Nob1
MKKLNSGAFAGKIKQIPKFDKTCEGCQNNCKQPISAKVIFCPDFKKIIKH